MNPAFEAVPKHRREPDAVFRARLLAAALRILARGERITHAALRAQGVRGATQRLALVRAELVTLGKLPPEAATRRYVRADRDNGAACLLPPVPPIPARAPPSPNLDRAPRRTLGARVIRLYGRDRLRRQFRK